MYINVCLGLNLSTNSLIKFVIQNIFICIILDFIQGSNPQLSDFQIIDQHFDLQYLSQYCKYLDHCQPLTIVQRPYSLDLSNDTSHIQKSNLLCSYRFLIWISWSQHTKQLTWLPRIIDLTQNTICDLSIWEYWSCIKRLELDVNEQINSWANNLQ